MTTLFSLPTTGNAFTAIKHSDDGNDASPPPRKAARHDSASHSPHKHRAPADGSKRNIRIILDTPLRQPSYTLQSLSKQVEGFIRSYLRRDVSYPASATQPSYEDIFLSCKLLMEADEGEQIRKILERTMRGCTAELVKELRSVESSEWAGAFNERWGWWLRRLNVLRSTLLYLDALFLVPKGELTIKELGYQAFSENVFAHPTISERSDNVIKQWSTDERANRSSPQQLSQLSKFIDCLATLGLYEEHVEQPYLRTTAEHYSSKARSSDMMGASEYLRLCVTDISAEEHRAEGILKDETVKLAAQSALCELIAPAVYKLAKDALNELITARDLLMPIHLHRLIARFTESRPEAIVPQEPNSPIQSTPISSTKSATDSFVIPQNPTEALLAYYRNDVFHRVRHIVTDAANDSTMVEKLLELKDYLDRLLGEEGLDDASRDKKWTYATSEAFERGFACRRIKPAEMIAKYIDQLMKQGQKSSTDAEFFAQMKRVLELYRFSPDKDVFRTFYIKALAKRLLLDRSASTDFEKEVLKFLSESYDAGFTDCTQMFNDLAVSKDLTEAYRTVKPGQPPRPDTKLEIRVLQHSVWPVIRRASRIEGVEIALPSKMDLALADYASFYKERHTNRQLSWAHYLGTATLIARFPNGVKELSMSLYQAVVLLLFNERDSWTMEEIQDRVALATPDLVLTIQSLALAKRHILKRTTPRTGKDVKPDDSFSFNDAFTDSKYKFHINTIQQTDTAEETEQTEKVIDQMREGSLDAAIVRIMKAKKTLKNQHLINEVIESVAKHFRPDVKMIKMRIESLLERDFIARKDGVADVWEYVA